MSMKRISIVFLVAVFSLLFCGAVKAQDGAYSSYSPYSIFGVGNIARQGTAYSKSMGGVGIASRNNRFINYDNPAAVTARDTLSFMLDFGLSGEGRVFRQGDVKSANNLLNINNLAFTVPIYKSSAMILGISPYSSMGYDFSHDINDPVLVATSGNINYRSRGQGSIYQLYFGAGVTFWDRLSVGAQLLYYFGNIDKATVMNFSSSSYRDVYSGYEINVNAVGGKFGIQYEQPLSSGYYLTAGATYKTRSGIKGYVTDYKYATISEVSDTLKHKTDTIGLGGVKPSIAGEIGVGVSLRYGDKWRVEFDYIRSDWGKSNLANTSGFAISGQSNFSTSTYQSFRAGFEIVPNRNDIRYYLRKCSYRAGLYYDTEYYKMNGNTVNSYGLTFGVTLPVYQWYNGISIGVDIGRRGMPQNGMIRETYATLMLGFNIHDIWFRKPKYD